MVLTVAAAVVVKEWWIDLDSGRVDSVDGFGEVSEVSG